MAAVEMSKQIKDNYETLRPLAMRFTKNTEDANDLIQETMLKALSNQDKFKPGTNIKGWLYTIMKNTFISKYHRVTKRTNLVDSNEDIRAIYSTGEVALNGGISLTRQKDIKYALKNVSEKYRKPFMMFFIGYKYHEIADKLEIPIGTVKNRIFVARKELSSQLEK